MRLFGTDGIRGRVNSNPMTPETVLRVGMAAAKVLKKKHGRNMVLIGKDTRLSGYMIESALTSGICSMGMNVTLVGPIPTPGVAFLTRALRLDAGIVISASHNPFEDNGIKIFSSDGFKLPDEMEAKIEELVSEDRILKRRPHGHDIGKAFRLEDAIGRYSEYIKSTVPKGMTLEGLKVVVDCANEAVVKHGADVGVAHDGDADRALFADEKGRVVDGDQVLGMWAMEMKQAGGLKENAVVATVMSNLGLEKYLQKNGIGLIRTKVGDRFVSEKMLLDGYNLGGEQSGHIVFFDYNTTGDGPITALHVLYLMKKTGRPLSSLAGEIELFPQVLINVPVKKRSGFASIPEIKKSMEDAERKLGETGRVFVRPSGTERKIRVMLEGEDLKLIKRLGNRIAGVIKEKMA
jgi:phosphoglucosamine mutase